MQGLRWITPTDDEMDEFLGRGGTGLLSFAADSDRPPVLRPVSYGYNADTRNLFFRLSLSPGSDKASVVDNPVAFARFDQREGLWFSVVATGRLEELEELPYDASAVQELWDVQIPDIDVFDRPQDEVPFRKFRLVPDHLDGRKEVASE